MIKPSEVFHGPVCGIFAAFLAAPSVFDFNTAYGATKAALGRRDNWQGWMYWSELQTVLTHFGVRFKELNNDDCIGLTLGRAVKDGCFLKGKQYIIRAGRHFVTVRNGLVYDQSNPHGQPAAEHRSKRSKVTHVILLK